MDSKIISKIQIFSKSLIPEEMISTSLIDQDASIEQQTWSGLFLSCESWVETGVFLSAITLKAIMKKILLCFVFEDNMLAPFPFTLGSD
ncbi:hypothetical protein VULLAG_LOCUS4123 [Vulpes lagopus]